MENCLVGVVGSVDTQRRVSHLPAVVPSSPLLCTQGWQMLLTALQEEKALVHEETIQ